MSTTALSVYGSQVEHHLPLARLLDELGFDGLWLGQHLVAPVAYRSVSEYRKDEVVVPLDIDLLDPWVGVAAALAATTRLCVATGLHIAPLRPPLADAQAAVTMGRLFPGRFIYGVAAGWLAEEFDAVGIPFRQRGSRLEEAVDIVRRASAGGPFEFRGKHHSFDAVQISQHPVDVPIVMGGLSDVALRRAARVADGWYNPGTLSLDDCSRVRDQLEVLREAAGRGAVPFRYHIRVRGVVDATLVESYRQRGFDDVTIPWQGLWEQHDSLAVKEAAVRRLATELGITSVDR